MIRTRSPSGAIQQQHYHDIQISDEEEHPMMDDDDIIDEGEFIDEEDSGSSLSIPNESIDFDLVYAFHSFAATVEGQANVVKGDSLRLIDDSNSYWWLVNVLNTQDVGYIPAENIETPLERLARLNKHRNIDLTYPTQQEQNESNRRIKIAAGSQIGGSATPQRSRPRVIVNDDRLTVHTYLPAIWNEDEYDEEEDDEIDYDEDEEGDIHAGINNSVEALVGPADHVRGESEDDEMEWRDEAGERQAAGLSIQIIEPPVLDRREQESRVVQQSSIGLGQPPGSLRPQTSRERLFAQQQQAQGGQLAVHSSPILDPAEATETRRITATPDLVRDHDRSSSVQRALSPASNESDTIRPRSDSPKRSRDEEESILEESGFSKRINASKSRSPEQDRTLVRSTSAESRLSSSSSGHGTNKLRKDKEKPVEHEEEKERKEEKKKKGGVLSSLFGRRNKDKDKAKAESSSDVIRQSEDSARSSSAHGRNSSIGRDSTEGIVTTRQTPGQQGFTTPPRQTGVSPQDFTRNSTDPRKPQVQQTVPNVNVSPHTLKLQQTDQQWQAIYHAQHLTRGPGSPENHVQPSYGLQSASEFLNTSLKAQQTPERQRPGSLLLSPSTNDKPGVPMRELTVIRVFAGDGLQTEATFKTVLVNSSTSSGDLIKQAMQRFRLAGGEEARDYYLTIKQVDGPSAELKLDEKPLVMFEGLVEASRLPKFSRNSVGSISSLVSNLSMHPAIQNLTMNDFTDDSAVKFYLNRRHSNEAIRSAGQIQNVARPPRSSSAIPNKPPVGAHGATLYPGSLAPERFSSPGGARFAVQLLIYPDDLPEGMVFDPQTEAIIPKSALRERPQSTGSVSGISSAKRRKILMFPKNTTVAEVIELGLERFGIPEGVVDGGDEVEDKAVNRRSLSRVRYGLAVQLDGQAENILAPTSKILEAFPQPPIFREAERRSFDGKRRSADSSSLLGVVDDVQPGDPVFILRRGARLATNRHSTPLDEVALHRMQRDSMQSIASGSTRGDETPTTPKAESPKPQLSRQELIAAQRAASRANQRALLTSNNDSERGIDLLLPDRAVIRSSYQQPGDKIRYSYVDPDGEAYDISDIIEDISKEQRATPGLDLVGSILRNDSEQLDRVLNKIRSTKADRQDPTLQTTDTLNTIATTTSTSSSQSLYSDDTIRMPAETSVDPSSRRAMSPIQQSLVDRARSPAQQVNASRAMSPSQMMMAARAISPTQQANSAERAKSPLQQISSSRAKSPTSGSVERAASPPHGYGSRSTTPVSRYATPLEITPSSRSTTPTQYVNRAARLRSGTPTTTNQKQQKHASNSTIESEYAPTPIDPIQSSTTNQQSSIPPGLRMPNNIDLEKMWRIIEASAHLQRTEKPDPLDPVEEMLFGPKIDVEKLHPEVQEIVGPLFGDLERIEKELDDRLFKLLDVKLEAVDNHL